MKARRARPALALGLALGAAVGGWAHAQNTLSTDPFEGLPPSAAEEAEAALPQVVFSLEAEIALPGPLPPDGPRWDGEAIVIPVAGGTAIVEPLAGATPRIVAAPAPETAIVGDDVWIETADGTWRFRSLDHGLIQAQKRCDRCSKGWRKRWKLRVPGNTLTAPVTLHGRVFFGALDNRIYCVKMRNGHRVWVADVDGRVTRRLVPWSEIANSAGDETGTLIFAILDDGSELIALNAMRGVRVGGLKLANGDGKWVDAPAAIPGGPIVVARQKYEPGEASLMIYRLSSATTQAIEPLAEGDDAAAASALSAPPAESARR